MLYVMRTQSGEYIFIGTIGPLQISTPSPLPEDVAKQYAVQLRSLLMETGGQVEISNIRINDPVVKILKSTSN